MVIILLIKGGHCYAAFKGLQRPHGQVLNPQHHLQQQQHNLHSTTARTSSRESQGGL